MAREAAQLHVRVSPGARRPGIAGRHGNAWKIRVAAPPQDGRANAAVVELLARTLAVPSRAVTLVAGATSRDKVIEVEGITVEEAERRLGARAGKGEE